MAPLADLDATEAFMKAARGQFSKPIKPKAEPLNDDNDAKNAPPPHTPAHVYPSSQPNGPTYITLPVNLHRPPPPPLAFPSIFQKHTFNTPFERNAVPVSATKSSFRTASVIRRHQPIVPTPAHSRRATQSCNPTAEIEAFIISFTTASFLNGRTKVLAAPRACLPRRYDICELIMLRRMEKVDQGAMGGWTVLGPGEEEEPEERKDLGRRIGAGTMPYWW